jgi:alkanesulfonate monooxygenase SsuD/methylene tetrahydromethanopterin reductase-like flavin-dependent oxidoreductase (luciferase family)
MLYMVICADTDEEALAKWDSYEKGEAARRWNICSAMPQMM